MTEHLEHRCNRLLEQIDEAKAALTSKRPPSQAELAKLREDFIVDFTYNSNAIEGNALTLSETALVLKDKTVPSKPLKDHLEAIGHRDAYLYLEMALQERPPITEELIRDIHSHVLMNEPLEKGNYRTLPVIITRSKHIPPNPELVLNMVKDLVSDFQTSNLHTVEQATIFHLDFEGIHPFVDGNGRTGRLLINFFLMKDGYLPISIRFTDRERYYRAFGSYHETNSPVEMVILTAENTLAALQERMDVLDCHETTHPS